MTNTKKLNAMLKRNNFTEFVDDKGMAQIIANLVAKTGRENIGTYEAYVEFTGSFPSSKAKYVENLSKKKSDTSAKRGRPSKIIVLSKEIPESTIKADEKGMYTLRVYNEDKSKKRDITMGSYECLLLNKLWFDKKGIKTKAVTT